MHVPLRAGRLPEDFLSGQFRDIEGIEHEWIERYYEQERLDRQQEDQR